VVAAFFCLGIALMVAGAIFKQHVYRRVMLSPDGWFLAEQSVELSSDGLSATGTYGEARYTWRAFRHLMEDDANLYLFVDNGHAFVLPKAALGSSDQVSQVKKWLQP
jgi:YcxB-like protein